MFHILILLKTKNSDVKEFNIGFDLTLVSGPKNRPACSSDKVKLSTYGNINIIVGLKHFQYDEFKIRFKFI